jgi:hypothetical protein
MHHPRFELLVAALAIVNPGALFAAAKPHTYDFRLPRISKPETFLSLDNDVKLSIDSGGEHFIEASF